MPTTHKYRVWCKTCNDFILHTKKEEEDLKCGDCDTVYTEIFLKDIPEDKIIEQRVRYKDQKRAKLNETMRMFMESAESRKVKEMMHMFSPPGSSYEKEIYESDAGQKTIDEENAKIREAQLEEEKRIKDEQKEEAAKYKGLGRNDICVCGSGLKYKKCCLIKIESYR